MSQHSESDFISSTQRPQPKLLRETTASDKSVPDFYQRIRDSIHRSFLVAGIGAAQKRIFSYLTRYHSDPTTEAPWAYERFAARPLRWSIRRLGPAVLLWLPGRDDKSNLIKLSVFSLLFTSFFLFVGDVQFPGGAQQFTDWASAIANGNKLSLDITQRAVGYAALIWLTGFPYTSSLIPLILVQATFAFLMPLLAYLTVAKVSRVAAFTVAMVLMVSLAPYVLMKFIHHDQLHIILLMATAALGVAYCRSGRTSLLYMTAAAAIACTLTRPISQFVLPIILVVALYTDWAFGRFRAKGFRVKIVHFAAVIAIALFVGFLDQQYRNWVFNIPPGSKEPSYTGEQLFYGPYVNSAEFGVVIAPDIGPATKRLFDFVRDLLGPVPAESAVIRGWSAAIPPGTGFIEQNVDGLELDQLVDRMFAAPNATYFHIMTSGFASKPEISDIFLQSTLEVAKRYPWFMVRYINRNFFKLLFDPGWGHSMYNTAPYHPEPNHFFIGSAADQRGAVSLPSTTQAEIHFEAARNELARAATLMGRANAHYVRWYPPLTSITAVLMLVGFGICVFTSVLAGFGRGAVMQRIVPNLKSCIAASLVLTLLVLYHLLVTAITVEPYYRYHLVTLPLQIAAAGVGAYLLAAVAWWALSIFDARLGLAGMLHSLERLLTPNRNRPISGLDFFTSRGMATFLVTAMVAVVLALYAVYLAANIY